MSDAWNADLIPIFPRNFTRLHKTLRKASNFKEYHKLTGCRGPCHYKEYIQADKLTRPVKINNKTCTIKIFAASSDITVKSETYLFPFPALVAEFGGTLGLFLGVSFMNLWDGLEMLHGMGSRITSAISYC